LLLRKAAWRRNRLLLEKSNCMKKNIAAETKRYEDDAVAVEGKNLQAERVDADKRWSKQQ
jgi:hypothetical protein